MKQKRRDDGKCPHVETVVGFQMFHGPQAIRSGRVSGSSSAKEVGSDIFHLVMKLGFCTGPFTASE